MTAFIFLQMKDYLVIALFHACLLTVGAALPGPLRADNPLVRPFSDIAKEISERLLQKQAEDARTEGQWKMGCGSRYERCLGW